jgi:hypothetical protein
MRHDEFKLGLKFWMSGSQWLCTDVGSRVVIAICISSAPAGWLAGPPYAVVEVVVDEYDLDNCSLVPT